MDERKPAAGPLVPVKSEADAAAVRAWLGPSRSRGWDAATRSQVARRLWALRALKLGKDEPR